MWLVVLGSTLLLALLPWAPPLDNAAAVVNLESCNGCARCEADCPYSAITMGPRTDGAPFESQAVVNAANCVSCGICAGACPTATPFRRSGPLVPGIELPELTVQSLRDKTLAAAAGLKGNDRVIVYGCDHAGELRDLAGSGVAVVTLPCVGALPPAFMDFVISRRHADGVFLAGCSPSACFFRLGDQWTRQRVARQRDPYLRERVPRERLHLSFTTVAADRQRELGEFRGTLAAAGPMAARSPRSATSAVPVAEKSRA
jgi:ferredoxin